MGVFGSISAPLLVTQVGDSNRNPPNPGWLNTTAAISTIFSLKVISPQSFPGSTMGYDSFPT